jgi:ribonuclease Z
VAGPGCLVRYDNVYLQFDAGRATVLRLSEVAVSARQLAAVFLTHVHSDHCSGLPDLALTRDRAAKTHRCGCGWGGEETLTTVAPLAPLACVVPGKACERFVMKMLEAYQDDLKIRAENSDSNQHHLATCRVFHPKFDAPTEVWRSDPHPDIAPGVSVYAVANHHEPVDDSVAYRIETPRGAVVISGDTRACTEVEKLASAESGCGTSKMAAAVLVHEACLPRLMPNAHSAVAEYHADAEQVGALALRAGVATLVLTHLTPPPEAPMLAAQGVDVKAEYVRAVRKGGFTGELIIGQDLTTVAVGTPRGTIGSGSGSAGGGGGGGGGDVDAQ